MDALYPLIRADHNFKINWRNKYIFKDNVVRKLLLAGLLFPFSAVAQLVTVDKPVQCARTEVLLPGLMNSEYKEHPVWIGTDEESTFSLFVNEKTKSWTLVQFNQKVACVLGTGEKSRMVFPKVKS